MKKYMTLGYRVPHCFSAPLFGDRKQYGLRVNSDDPCWKEWEKTYLDFYYANQKESIGATVNNAGYRVMEELNLNGKKVLEIGPGDINHITYWQGRPSLYIIADIQTEMITRSASKLEAASIPYETHLLSRNETGQLPFGDNEFDVLISFYSLEHLLPLDNYLMEMVRVLKRGGKLMGAIPCEGGLAWGLGRFLTSRRWLKKNSSINPDKIICWEHPNFADQILQTLDSMMNQSSLKFWPLHLPSIDLNLVAKFIYEKS